MGFSTLEPHGGKIITSLPNQVKKSNELFRPNRDDKYIVITSLPNQVKKSNMITGGAVYTTPLLL